MGREAAVLAGGRLLESDVEEGWRVGILRLSFDRYCEGVRCSWVATKSSSIPSIDKSKISSSRARRLTLE